MDHGRVMLLLVQAEGAAQANQMHRQTCKLHATHPGSNNTRNNSNHCHPH